MPMWLIDHFGRKGNVNRLADDFAKATAELKVHKRTAANLREQLLIIVKICESESLTPPDSLCSQTRTAIPKLRVLARLTPLKSYLRQGEVSDLLDSVLEACREYVQSSNDELMREDIKAQREIYKADHDADVVNLKRLLRDCLRKNDIRQQLSKLSPDEISALRAAINLACELQSISDLWSDSHVVRLFREMLLRLGSESTADKNTNGLQDLTGKVIRVSQNVVALGAVCAVWTGELYGQRVALYSPRPDKYKQYHSSLMKNAPVWASFEHPHILPLLGICSGPESNRTALVSRWMEHGTVENFIRMNPGADRLKLITEMASGLAYLHSRSPPYVHGILSGETVLVNEEKQAVIGGFASTAFERGWMAAVRWLAPETISTNNGLSLASDVYGFGMKAYSIMTGSLPFDDINTPGPIIDLLMKGERPARPDRKLVHHGLDDRLWDLIRLCWAQDPRERPAISEIYRELEKMRELPVLEVRDLTGLITIPNNGLTSIRACGAFGDVRVGLLKDVGPVALKSLNVKGVTQPVLRNTKRFYREASIWNRLKHPNVLPFLGTADPSGLPTCLVSPWMDNGNLVEYMKNHSDESAIHIAIGVTRGLAYLHAHEPNAVVHGDLRGVNVLISNSGEPLLCDFGLAIILEDLTQMPISSLLQDAGNPRWMAPELFVGEQQASISTASDVWALGMVLLEIITLDMPYHELKNSAQVIVEVHKGVLPSRPTGKDAVRRGLNDDLWALMLKCWEKSPSDRPSASDVLKELEV